MNLEINFEKDYKDLVDTHLLNFGYTNLPSDLRGSLRIYYNYKNRIIKPIKWEIIKSKELSVPDNLITGFEMLVEKLEKGIDVKENLSTRVTDPMFFDSLLNDWGIHHLHLGESLRGDGFITRTGEVLFVRFVEPKAYFIIVGNHQSWSDRDLLKVIDDNWPETIEGHQFKNVIDIRPNPNSDDIALLRRANLNSAVEINGKFFSTIGGGVMTSGDNIMSIMAINDIFRKLHKMSNYVKSKKSFIEQKLVETGNILPDIVYGHLIVDGRANCYLEIEGIQVHIKIGSF